MKSNLQILASINKEIIDLTQDEANGVLRLVKQNAADPIKAAQVVTDFLNTTFPVTVSLDLIYYHITGNDLPQQPEQSPTPQEQPSKIVIGKTEYWYNLKTDTLFYDEGMRKQTPLNFLNNADYQSFLTQLQAIRNQPAVQGDIVQRQ